MTFSIEMCKIELQLTGKNQCPMTCIEIKHNELKHSVYFYIDYKRQFCSQDAIKQLTYSKSKEFSYNYNLMTRSERFPFISNDTIDLPWENKYGFNLDCKKILEILTFIDKTYMNLTSDEYVNLQDEDVLQHLKIMFPDHF